VIALLGTSRGHARLLKIGAEKAEEAAELCRLAQTFARAGEIFGELHVVRQFGDYIDGQRPSDFGGRKFAMP
jgi:hypothetical protein